jgi:hypothetical protein
VRCFRRSCSGLGYASMHVLGLHPAAASCSSVNADDTCSCPC